MPNLTSYSLDQIRSATKAQIITVINTRLQSMTKRAIILFLMDADVISIAPTVTYGANGQVASQTEVVQDMETAGQVSARTTIWSYYPNGSVDTITIQTFDASNALTGTTKIKHYTDGKQPEVIA